MRKSAYGPNMAGPRIGVTLGDPSGVGPEIVARALASAPAELRQRVTVFGDAALLVRRGGPHPGVKITEVTHLTEEDSSPGRPTNCTATARPDTSTGTTTAGSPARFQACVYGTRAADVSIVDR